MKSALNTGSWLLGGAIALVLIWPAVAWTSEITVVGEVNEQGEVIASDDGIIYRVVEGETGQTLVNDHMGEKVQVRGVVVGEEQAAEDDERMVKLLQVSAFTVLAE